MRSGARCLPLMEHGQVATRRYFGHIGSRIGHLHRELALQCSGAAVRKGRSRSASRQPLSHGMMEMAGSEPPPASWSWTMETGTSLWVGDRDSHAPGHWLACVSKTAVHSGGSGLFLLVTLCPNGSLCQCGNMVHRTKQPNHIAGIRQGAKRRSPHFTLFTSSWPMACASNFSLNLRIDCPG